MIRKAQWAVNKIFLREKEKPKESRRNWHLKTQGNEAGLKGKKIMLQEQSVQGSGLQFANNAEQELVAAAVALGLRTQGREEGQSQEVLSVQV
jgi:hypothetical protein